MSRSNTSRALLALLAALLLLLAGDVLRLYDLGTHELSFDEVATYFVARRSPAQVIAYTIGAVREHPPLYYIGISLWMRVAGSGEFALRYPSALIGILTIAAAWRLGQRWLGTGGAWRSALLFALAPFALWASRTARMYSAVMLLAVLTVCAWMRWARRPSLKRWLGVVALMAVGILTHYFVVFVWVALTVALLLAPRQTARIRWTWLGTLGGLGLVLALFIAVSPGVRLTVLSILARFPLREIRLADLQLLIAELYLMWRDQAHVPLALIALALTFVGWIYAWRRDRLTGAVLSAWGGVSTILLNFVPVDLEGRYLIGTLPALLFGLAAVATLPRPRGLRWLITAILLVGAPLHWEQVYHPLEGTFATQVQFLRAAACEGDTVLFNGPWPRLLLEYYPAPGNVAITAVPAEAPPGFTAETDIPRLDELAATNKRLWVFYGAVGATDPSYAVSRWLAEHMHSVLQVGSMVLYVPESPMLPLRAGSVPFGEVLELSAVTVDKTTVGSGDLLKVAMTWQLRALQGKANLTLALLDGAGTIRTSSTFDMGPVHHPSDLELPSEWVERAGLWIRPGLVPGNYTLAVRVEAEGAQSPESSMGPWVALGSIAVLPSTSPGAESSTSLCVTDMTQVLPNPYRVKAKIGGLLEVVGVEPWDLKGMQGYPIGFDLWWLALDRPGALDMEIRLLGKSTIALGTISVGTPSYDSEEWLPLDTVLQQVTVILPDDMPGGDYRLQVRLRGGTGRILAAIGTRRWMTEWERLSRPVVDLQGTWVDLFPLEVEVRDRAYSPPLLREKADVQFGEWLRLRGYRLGSAALRPGESTSLTLYWQAAARPPQAFAAFNHLRRAGETPIWTEDSWPQQGLYTTNHWLKGEVVAETYTVNIPEDAPLGEYPLYVGLYDPVTGDRLPAVDKHEQRIANDEVVLCTITIGP